MHSAQKGEMRMKGFIKEFKDFVCRGNVLDMAVGVIIGAAFKDIVTSLTDNIISPIIGMFGGANFDAYSVTLFGKATLNYGMFLTAVINFLIMAFVVFLIVKFVNTITKAFTRKKADAAPTTKTCPYCKSEIPLDAVKCAHCTSDVE